MSDVLARLARAARHGASASPRLECHARHLVLLLACHPSNATPRLPHLLSTAAIEGGGYAAGLGDARFAQAFTQRADATYRAEAVCRGDADGVAIVCEPEPLASSAFSSDEEAPYEERMRRGLSSVRWQKVGVRFRGASTLLPMAHNKLPALRRQGWRRAFEFVEQAHEGEGVMEELGEWMWRELKKE